jgi:hypothetical protein
MYELSYLTGVITEATDRVVRTHDTEVPLGLMVTPATGHYRHATRYPLVGIDNGCFTAAGRRRFTPDGYLALIEDCAKRWGDYCTFATAPDVVGDWQATLRASLPFLPRIRQAAAAADVYGIAAIVLQDGATVETVPWGEIDAVFVGGSTEWKVGTDAAAICREARRRGLHVHMGRVNSLKRLNTAYDFCCDTADGTCLRFEQPEAGVEKVLEWLRAIVRRGKAEAGTRRQNRQRAVQGDLFESRAA